MKPFAILPLLLACLAAPAQAAFIGPDFSGIYDCTGEDDREGHYTGTVTLKLVPGQTKGKHAAYLFQLEVPGFGDYPGHGVAHGKQMAIYFANSNQSPEDSGTGFATFSQNKDCKWTFTKYYFQPDYQGGNSGTESCVQR